MQADPSFAHTALTALSGVNRFSMVAAMLPKALKAQAAAAIQAVGAAGLDVAALKKAYRV